MATYDFNCPSCGWTGERFTKWDDRDNQTCNRILVTVTYGDRMLPGDEPGEPVQHGRVCGAKLEREEIPLTAPGRADGRFVMKGILANGQKVPMAGARKPKGLGGH